MPTALVRPALNFDFWITMWEVQGPTISLFSSDADDPGAAIGAGLLSAAVSVGATFLFGTFSEIRGLDTELELEDYHEGGNNRAALRFVKKGQHPELVLKRGVTYDTSLADWYHQVRSGNDARLRKDGIILLMDRGGPGVTDVGLPGLDRMPVAGWYFRRALPKRIVGPSLNAKGNEVAIEQLELAHEGLDRIPPALIPGASDFLGAFGGAGSLAAGAAVAGVGAAAT